jgi:hypothetical protein
MLPEWPRHLMRFCLPSQIILSSHRFLYRAYARGWGKRWSFNADANVAVDTALQRAALLDFGQFGRCPSWSPISPIAVTRFAHVSCCCAPRLARGLLFGPLPTG